MRPARHGGTAAGATALPLTQPPTPSAGPVSTDRPRGALFTSGRPRGGLCRALRAGGDIVARWTRRLIARRGRAPGCHVPGAVSWLTATQHPRPGSTPWRTADASTSARTAPAPISGRSRADWTRTGGDGLVLTGCRSRQERLGASTAAPSCPSWPSSLASAGSYSRTNPGSHDSSSSRRRTVAPSWHSTPMVLSVTRCISR